MHACIYDSLISMYINKRKNLEHIKRVIITAEQEKKNYIKKYFENVILLCGKNTYLK